MKVLEIILLILIIIIIYPGINYLKKASEKVRKLGDSGAGTASFEGTNYYVPKNVWSEDGTCIFKFGGTSVLGSGICRTYTYEQALVAQKTDSNGNFNLLSNVAYVRPNLNTSMEDFVNGNSHLTGKITDIENPPKTICIDPDQISSKHVVKTCQPEKGDSLNKCYDNQGNIINSGENFSYNLDCASSICPGEVGCISLNYSATAGNISVNTFCMSIEGISIPRSLESVYNLDFYNILGILNFDDSIGTSGPYPVKFKFSPCDNTDARQKFKITRFTGVGASGDGVCTNLDHTLKYDAQGSYASLVFRGLDSYLDSEDGNFVLRPMNGQGVSQSIKWIFFPETNITNKTVPSTQRCVGLRSNIYPDTSILAALEVAGTEGAVWGGIKLAKLIGSPISRIGSFGRFIARGARGAINFFGGNGAGGESSEDIELDSFPSSAAEGGEQAGGDAIAESNIDAAAETGGEAAADAAADAGVNAVVRAAENEGLEDLTDAAISGLASAAATAATALASAGSALASTLTALSSLLEVLGPVAIIFMILSLVFSFVPDPTYDPNNPIVYSGAFTKGQTVSPTNFGSDVTISGPGAFGEAPIIPLDQICINRQLDSYPPYFLEAVSDGTIISSQFINYNYKAAYHISARKVVSFGTAQNAYGLWIYTDEGNLKPSAPGNLWQDGETTWLVKNPLSESVAFPKEYFTDSKSSSVYVEPPTTSGNPVSEFGFEPVILSPTDSTGGRNSKDVFGKLTASKQGLIKKLDFSSKISQKELNFEGRFTNDYLQSSSYTTGSGVDATFNVIVSDQPKSVTDFTTKITSITIDDPGYNYKVNDTITIPYDIIGGSSTGASMSFGVSTVSQEVFIFKAAEEYRYIGKSTPTNESPKRENGKSYFFPPETAATQLPLSDYQFVNGGFEITAVYASNSNRLEFKNSSKTDFYVPLGTISGGEGYSVGNPIYLIQYDINGVNLQDSGDTSVINTGDITVNTSECLRVNVTQLQATGYTYDSQAPGSLLEEGFNRKNFYLEYNFMDNASNIFSPCPQQIVYGGETRKEGNLISVLSSKIKGNLKPKDIGEIFLSESFRDPATGVLKEGPDSLLNLKSLQVSKLGYNFVNIEDFESVVQTDITGSEVSLKRFIPYSFFVPAYYDDARKAVINLSNLDPPLKYGISTYFYNQNYAQIIPYGIPDVYNNYAFIKNAPRF